jgi:hypothetical protein
VLTASKANFNFLTEPSRLEPEAAVGDICPERFVMKHSFIRKLSDKVSVRFHETGSPTPQVYVSNLSSGQMIIPPSIF